MDHDRTVYVSASMASWPILEDGAPVANMVVVGRPPRLTGETKPVESFPLGAQHVNMAPRDANGAPIEVVVGTAPEPGSTIRIGGLEYEVAAWTQEADNQVLVGVDGLFPFDHITTDNYGRVSLSPAGTDSEVRAFVNYLREHVGFYLDTGLGDEVLLFARDLATLYPVNWLPARSTSRLALANPEHAAVVRLTTPLRAHAFAGDAVDLVSTPGGGTEIWAKLVDRFTIERVVGGVDADGDKIGFIHRTERTRWLVRPDTALSTANSLRDDSGQIWNIIGLNPRDRGRQTIVQCQRIIGGA